MRITLCGSVFFYEEMLTLRQELQAHGHEVRLPSAAVIGQAGEPVPVGEHDAQRKAAGVLDGWVWKRKAEAMRNHFEKVAWSDGILVLNLKKNSVAGYIGSNTFLEMGLAFHLRKLIFLWCEIPQMPCREEILGMSPLVVSTDLSLIPSQRRS